MVSIKSFIRLSALFLSIAYPYTEGYPIPAIPTPISITQPDGSCITVVAKGDEKGFCMTTIDGIPVVKNHQDILEYADPKDLSRCSGVKANNSEYRTLQEEAWIKNQNYRQVTTPIFRTPRKLSVNSDGYLRISNYPTIGRQKALVVLVEFDDCPFSTMDNPYEYYDGMLNEKGFTYKNGANGSARDFYNYSSCGKFDPEFVVVGPVRLSGSVADYGGDTEDKLDPNAWKMVVEACKTIDDEIDFSEFDTDGDGAVDSIYFFYAGFGEADSLKGDVIWPHNGLLLDNWDIDLVLDGKRINNYACSNEIRFSSAPLWQPVGIGTFVHEFGHVLGLVDHYDTSYTSGRTGVTDWDTMAAASYHNDQNTPPAFSAYERAALGWLELDEVDPHHAGLLHLKPLSGTDASAFRITVPDTDQREFFVIERRSQSGWDATLPASGILVWHIDENPQAWESNHVNTDPIHQHIDIVEADGLENASTLYGDVFPGPGKVTHFHFDSWNQSYFFGFDHIKQLDNESVILLSDTDFTPLSPDIRITDVHGTSFVIDWSEVPDALAYKLQVTDPDGNIVNGFDFMEFAEPTAVSIEGLTPLTEYFLDLRSVAGSYQSHMNMTKVTTGKMEFFESQPQNVEISKIGEDSWNVSWDALEEADDYAINVYNLVYSEPNCIEYGFEDGLDCLPDGWACEGGSLSRSMFGKHSPALKFSDTGNHLAICYPDACIKEISFFHRSQTASNSLDIECFDNTGVLISTVSVAASTSGTTSVIPLPDNTSSLRMTFIRSSGYMVVDDMIAEVGFLTPMELPLYSDIRTGGVAAFIIKGFPDSENNVVSVTGICGDIMSRPSEMIPMQGQSDVGVISIPTTITEEEVIYDLHGNRVRTANLLPGIYVSTNGNRTKKIMISK